MVNSPGHNHFWILDDVINNGFWCRLRGNSFTTTTHHVFLYISLLSHTTTSGKYLISRFMEEVNKRRLNFLSLYELEYGS